MLTPPPLHPSYTGFIVASPTLQAHSSLKTFAVAILPASNVHLPISAWLTPLLCVSWDQELSGVVSVNTSCAILDVFFPLQNSWWWHLLPSSHRVCQSLFPCWLPYSGLARWLSRMQYVLISQALCASVDFRLILVLKTYPSTQK